MVSPLVSRTITLRYSLSAALLGALSACSSDDSGPDRAAPVVLTSSVVFGDESETTYINELDSLDEQEVELSSASEFPGWADLWVHHGKVLIADGESPVVTSYDVAVDGGLTKNGAISFANYGVSQAAFSGHVFVSDTKAYWFNTSEREVVIWDPSTLEISGSFALPELPNRGAQLLAGPTADRASVVRGDRAYVVFHWGDWTNYSLSDDSVIVVLDTTSDEVLDVIEVPCPELNFASIDDSKTIYFSSWGYSAVPTLLDGKPKACAVRLLDGEDAPDPDWSLTFADVTEGREASALRALGGGKALLTVFHDERVELTPDADRYALTDSANWRLWMLDLESLEAKPLDSLGWHAPGLQGTRIDGQTFISAPSGDYASSSTYRFALDGTAELLWESPGWQTRLFKLDR